MQIPASFIVLKVRPSYFLFVCEIGSALSLLLSPVVFTLIFTMFLVSACLGWTIFTFAQAGVKTSGMMYFFRFMVGLFESAFSPVIIFLMGSWSVHFTLFPRQPQTPQFRYHDLTLRDTKGTQNQNWRNGSQSGISQVQSAHPSQASCKPLSTKH